MSLPEPSRSSPGASSSRRSASSRPRSSALLEHDAEIARVAASRASAARRSCAWSATARPTTRRRTASTRSGCSPRWTALRDSITLTVHYGTRARPVAARRSSACRSRDRRPTWSSTSARARAAARFTVAVTNDPDSELAAAAEAALPLAAGPEHAVAATKTYLNQLAALALLAGASPAAGPAVADGIRGPPTCSRTRSPTLEAATRGARAPVRVRRPDVRDRPRHRVRDRARDRAEAARDLPHRRRAADRDRPRARPGRRARPALPGLGDRLAPTRRCRPCRRRPRASTPMGATRRRERHARPRRSRAPTYVLPVPMPGRRCSLRSSRSCPASCSRGRSPARGPRPRHAARADQGHARPLRAELIATRARRIMFALEDDLGDQLRGDGSPNRNGSAASGCS